MDWFMGVLTMALTICIIGFGFALGKNSVANDCRNFSAFTSGQKAFICKENGEVK